MSTARWEWLEGIWNRSPFGQFIAAIVAFFSNIFTWLINGTKRLVVFTRVFLLPLVAGIFMFIKWAFNNANVAGSIQYLGLQLGGLAALNNQLGSLILSVQTRFPGAIQFFKILVNVTAADVWLRNLVGIIVPVFISLCVYRAIVNWVERFVTWLRG